MTKHVAFVGPLPPPVHGFSNICAIMLDLLKARMLVVVFDRAPKVSNRFLTILLQLTKPLLFFLVCLRRRDVILYLALSGGSGQVIENLTRQNMAMFERAMSMFSPFAVQARRAEDEGKANGTAAPAPKPSEDISELKSEIEAMRRQLAELSQRK